MISAPSVAFTNLTVDQLDIGHFWSSRRRTWRHSGRTTAVISTPTDPGALVPTDVTENGDSTFTQRPAGFRDQLLRDGL